MRGLLGITVTIAVVTSLWAMPPSPDVVEQLRQEERLQQWIEVEMDARSRGMNQSFDFDREQLMRDDPDDIEVHAICILVDFDDNEANENQFSVEHYQSMLFSEGEYQSGSMRDFYLENSYGDVHIVGEVYGWYRMPQDYAYYVDGQRGMGNYPRNGQRMTEDALRAADDDVDFREFDNNANGVVEALFIVHAGQGAEATGDDDMIHSHAWNVPQGLFLDRRQFRRYAMEPDDGRIGVFGHELGHSYFGLPDLYDTDYNSRGIGMWSMMAGGSWGGGGNRPVHFDAWCKQRIGLSDPNPIVNDAENIVLEPMELEDDQLITWRNGDWNREYFLIENRQHLGFDRSLPGSGILIWHIDENKDNNRNPWWPGQGRDHNIVAIEQADGNYDLERNNNAGDTGDPFPGSGRSSMFAEHTEPDSRDYQENGTDITVYYFEQVDSIRVRFNIALQPIEFPDPSVFIFNRIPDNHRYPNPDIRDQEVMVQEIDLITEIFERYEIGINDIDDELPDDLSIYNVVIYLDTWREGEEAAEGLTVDEQGILADYLDGGGNLLMIGPDIATSLQGDDAVLWEYLNAEYVGEGLPMEEGNVRVLRGAPESPVNTQTFPYQNEGICDHYVDIVGAGEGSRVLFTDQRSEPRGLSTVGENGERIILQPFLNGGLRDWGGTKAELMRLYLDYFRFFFEPVSVPVEETVPSRIELITAFPNPFNSTLQINYQWLGGSRFFTVYDALGRQVGEIGIPQGSGSASWKPNGIASGSYYIMPEGNNQINPVKVTFIK